MRALESPDGSKEKLAADETWSSLASAITAETLNSSSRAQLEKPSPGDVAEDGDSKPAAKGRPKKKRETIPKNVGGWVSPAFAQDIDRSWLEADNTPKKFDLSSYIPQVGDTVLYYPAGHRQFLEANPDILGKKTRNITRMTLWDRAKKEKSKMEKATAQDEADNGESQVNAESKVSNWWNEDWLSLIDGDLDRYPILCRVEKTHAEFPPDPLSDAKVVTNDKTGAVQVTWKPKKGGPKKHQESPPLRLAVMLRPLTPALPPQQSSGDSASTELALPPNFYVVTFPSKASPFLIPFSLAYKLSHSLSNGDAIRRASSTKPDWRGKVANFKALESDSLHFSTRLDDKMDSIRELCDSLKSGKKTFAASLEEALYSDSRATIPLTDACVVIERFESALKDITADTTGSRKKSDGTTPNMMHLIRSTLPLWNEVVVASGSGKERSASAWELWSSNEEAERAGPLISTSADIEPESGLVYTIDEPLRAKLECTIEDFLKDTPDAGLFFQLVTDEEAPSYSQAVPRGMAFSKILKRLQVGKRQGESRCYYRTIDSLLGDVVAIADNCFLYNSPESLVVQKVDEIIPAIKRLIAHVTSQHLKEKEAIEKSIEERRQAIMMQCNAPAVRVDENEGNELSSRNRAGPAKRELQQPYNGILHRTWIQDIVSDKSWSVSDKPTDQQSSTARVVGNVEWVPQSGDNIFYSRSLHADFVKGHHPSLTTEQCIVPQLSTESDNAAPDTLQDHWLVGKIVWVRAAFPRAPSKRDPDYENTFEVASPVLELGMRFHYSWASKNIYTVFWRPCTFAKEGEDDGAKTIPSKVSSGKKRKSQGSDAAVTAGTEDESTKSPARCKCNACGLDVDASFVRPTWIPLANQGSTGSESAELTSYLTPDASSFAENPFANPTGIPEQSITSIGRCLDVLKRRCLDGVPANHVDPRLTTANVKDGFSPPAAKIGRNLPTFDRLLTRVELGDNENVTIGMGHTDKRNVALLAEANYLPQWTLSLSEGMRKKTNPNSIAQRRALHETLSPNPNFCLELIQARLRGGYYRNIIGLAHDIQEAYVSSVLLLLARPAARKVQPISIRRIAKALASTKDLVSFAKTNSKATSKKAAPVVKLEEKETAKNSALSNEEQEWFEQLFHIRKLYATALASVLQPECTERVFGVVPPKTKPKAAAKKKPAAFDAEKEQAFMKARNTLGFIFETLLIKDPCGNRPVAASWNPSVKVRIRFTGQEPQKKGGKRASNAKLPMSGEDSRPVDDVDTTKPLVFESSDYEFNEDLVTLFFGKPLKMSRCGRCSAHGRSIMMCRVRRKHELPDFDWLTVFQGSGGLDGLLHTLRTGEPPGEFMSAGSVANRPENQPSGASVNVGGDLSNAVVGKVDPIAILEKAKKAVMFADQVLAKAEKFSKAPVRLSEEFVKHSFPIDPDDDHYNYCILCGLIGDVICCEGCPNVVHPRCVNLEDIPDEDWYCSRCQREGKVPAIDEKTNGKNVPESQKPSAIATACEGPDLLPETMAAPDGLDDDADRLETILAELKSMRPIQPKKLKQPKKASDEEQKGEDSDKDGDSDKDDEDDEPSPPALSLRRSSRNPRRSGSGDDNDDSSLGEDSDHDVRAPPSRIRVGMRVKKKFGDRYFYGKILVRALTCCNKMLRKAFGNLTFQSAFVCRRRSQILNTHSTLFGTRTTMKRISKRMSYERKSNLLILKRIDRRKSPARPIVKKKQTAMIMNALWMEELGEICVDPVDSGNQKSPRMTKKKRKRTTTTMMMNNLWMDEVGGVCVAPVDHGNQKSPRTTPIRALRRSVRDGALRRPKRKDRKLKKKTRLWFHAVITATFLGVGVRNYYP